MDQYSQLLAGYPGNWLLFGIGALILLVVLLKSVRSIGPTEVGLVRKRFSFRKLGVGNAVAFRGEAGYQARLMMPGIQFKFWPLYDVTRRPMVQIPSGQIGVVIAQAGIALPVGAKSGIYKPEFGNFQDLPGFIAGGGQKGVQRPVLPPGTVVPIHPVGFLVITKDTVYGVPIDEAYARLERKGALKPQSFGLDPEELDVVRPPSAPMSQKAVRFILKCRSIFTIRRIAACQAVQSSGRRYKNCLRDVVLEKRNHNQCHALLCWQ